MLAVALTTSLPAEAFAAYDNLLEIAPDLSPIDLQALAAKAAQKKKETPDA
jgi:beta-phosphoglucomutase